MSDVDLIVAEIRNGSSSEYVIAVARPNQYPKVLPRSYNEVARVRDINDVGRVAAAFGWEGDTDE